MRRFVFWTGVYNLVASIPFFVPGSMGPLAINVSGSVFLFQTVGALVVFLGIALMICSRDLATRAPLVCWEGILRITLFLVSAVYAFLQDAGVMLAVIMSVDLFIGLVYLIGLPRTLHRSLADLLLDRPAQPFVSTAR